MTLTPSWESLTADCLLLVEGMWCNGVPYALLSISYTHDCICSREPHNGHRSTRNILCYCVLSALPVLTGTCLLAHHLDQSPCWLAAPPSMVLTHTHWTHDPSPDSAGTSCPYHSGLPENLPRTASCSALTSRWWGC